MHYNLDLLQFFHFNKNKRINNLILSKDNDVFLDKNIDVLKENIKIILKMEYIDDIGNLFTANFNRFHKIKDNELDILWDVIEKLYCDLYEDLNQIFENKKNTDINFYQIKLFNECRLIFVIHKKYFYPLIFDFNHCFYTKKEKEYDNNKTIKTHKWDLREKENKIKSEIIKNLNNNN